MDFFWCWGGLLWGEKVFNYYCCIMLVIEIECCECWFVVVVINLSIGRELWFIEGDLYLVICVFCSMLGLMLLVRYNGYWLVDGVVVNLVFVLFIWVMGVDIVIVVDL